MATTEPELIALQARSERVAEARAAVATQIAEMLTQVEVPGGRDVVAVRLRRVMEAERSGDRTVERAAWMEAAHACASAALRIDLALAEQGR